MRTQLPAVRKVLLAALIAGPTVLAFFSGGFFDQPRLVALIAAWLLLALAVVAGAPPLPQSRWGIVALGGLAAYTAWIALSASWSPLPADAHDDAQRALVYVGALAAAIALLRERAWARAAELGLTAGAVLVVAYGLSGRLLPGLVHQAASVAAAGRLNQPLTYWNAMGALGAIAFTLCARIAGDPERRVELRAGAGGGRGADAGRRLPDVLARRAGRGGRRLVVLTVLAPTWGQLRASAIALEVGLLGVFAAAAITPVRTTLGGTVVARDRRRRGVRDRCSG